MTIAQHLEVWLETLKSDGKFNYARKVGNRIKRVNRELRWTTMQQIEGLSSSVGFQSSRQPGWP